MRKYNPTKSKVIIENGRVYTVSEKVEAPASDLEIFEKMSDKDKKKRLDMIRKAVEKIDKKNMAKAKKDALAMMKSSGMFDEAIEETEEVTEDLSEARMPQYGKTKFQGKEFDKKKENKNIKNMIKSLHKLAKMQDNFQYTAEMGYNSKGGNPNDIYKNLVAAEQALYSYMIAVDRGVYDGTIEVDRD